MKKTLKKLMAAVLILAMTATFTPAFADVVEDGKYFETEYFKIGFDALEADAVIGNKLNTEVNGGKEDGMYSGFYMKNEVSGEEEGFYLYDGATYNNGASSKIIAGEKGNALEVTVADTKAVTPHIDFAHGMGIAPTSENSVMKITLDVMRSDLSAELAIRTKNSAGWVYDLLVFDKNGKIKLFGNEAMDYATGSWYATELCYNVKSNVWELYVGGELKKTVTKAYDMASLERMRITWTSPEGAETKIAFDNFSVSERIENETMAVYAGFDSLTPDSKIGGTANQEVNGGIEGSMWDGYYIKNEASGEFKGIYVSDGADYNNGASSNIIERESGNNAVEIKIDAAKDKALTPRVDFGLDLNIAPQKENSVIHIGYDICRYDMSCNWSLWLNARPKGWNYDFMEFTSDGKIKFFTGVVAEYEVGAWYDIDVYYSTVSGKFYLYINGDLVRVHLRGLNLETLLNMRATWTSPALTETKLALDNICIGELTAVEKKGALTVMQNGEAVSDNKFTTGTITAECELIEADSILPNVFVAQYDGNKLVGVSVGRYYDGKACASYEVTEAKGTVKVMLIETYLGVNPLCKNIELSAK